MVKLSAFAVFRRAAALVPPAYPVLRGVGAGADETRHLASFDRLLPPAPLEQPREILAAL